MKEKAKQEKSNAGSHTVNRRAFITMGAAVTAGVAAAQTKVVKGRMKKNDPDPAHDVAAVTDEEFDGAIRQIEATGMYDDAKRLPALRVVQRAIDRMSTSRAFLPCLHSQTPQKRIDAIHAEFPVMRWYDREFDRVFDQFTSTKVTGDTPAIWYLYNMGILVKTKSCAFGIDVFHRQDMRLVEHLDFLLVTHNIHIIRQIAPRVIVMDGGKICESGLTAEVLSNPKAPATIKLLDAETKLHGV